MSAPTTDPRPARVAYLGLVVGLLIAGGLAAWVHARVGAPGLEGDALADGWRMVAGEAPARVGPPWAWLLSVLARAARFDVQVGLRRGILGALTALTLAGVAWRGAPTWGRRVGALVALAPFALLRPAEAAPWALAALAISLEVDGARPSLRRALAAAGAWTLATWIDPGFVFPAGLAVLLAAALHRPGASAGAAARSAVVVLVALAAGWGLIAIAVPGAFAAALDPTGHLADPAGAGAVPAGGVGLGLLLGGVALAAAGVGDRGARAIGAAIPLVALGLLRGEAEDVALGALPALAGAASVAARAYPARFATFLLSALVLLLAAVGAWPALGPGAALHPSRLAAVSGARGPEAPRPPGCLHVPPELASATGGRPFGDGASVCPAALWALEGPRGGARGAARGFADGAILRWAARFEPRDLLGPDVVEGVRRPVAVAVSRAPLPVATGELRLALGEPQDILLGRAVEAGHLVRLRAHLYASRLEGGLGRAPRIEARFFAGDRPAGAAYVVPLRHALDRTRAWWLPVDAERAEWRWAVGLEDPAAPRADRLRLSLAPGPVEEAWLRVEGADELVPPPGRPLARACVDEARFDHAPADPRAAAPPRVGDGVIALRPATPAVAFGLAPCADVCLLGEAGLAEGGLATAATLEVELRAGPVRLDRFSRRLGRAYRRPFEVPAAGATSVRLVAEGPVDVHGLRLAPCASRVSLVHALHSGRYEAVRGEVGLSGDTLRLPVPPRGAAPTEVRVPLRVPTRACFATDLVARGASGPLAAVVGVLLEDGTLYRVDRQVFDAGDEALRSLRDVDLTPWAGRDVTLYLGAWSLGDAGGATVEVLRPRIHTCGEPAGWAF